MGFMDTVGKIGKQVFKTVKKEANKKMYEQANKEGRTIGGKTLKEWDREWNDEYN